MINTASATVTLIFKEPVFEGATDINIFYSTNGTLVGTATTNGTIIELNDVDSYYIQVMATGANFLNDPVAPIDYIKRYIPGIFIIIVGLGLMFIAVGLIVLIAVNNGGRR